MKKSSQLKFIKFPLGHIIDEKFKVTAELGQGWESSVYKVQEISTGIERAAKFFLPKRNLQNRAANFYAKKLHKLRNCSILIQYLMQERVWYEGHEITYLISEYVEGEVLSQFLKRQPGKRLNAFQAIHLLHALCKGLQEIHAMREYHGDLHSDNIIVQRHGLGFDLKLVDMYHWGGANIQNMRADICELIAIFYESLGGRKHYANLPYEIKDICCGLKRTLITQKFKTVGHLIVHLENLEWS